MKRIWALGVSVLVACGGGRPAESPSGESEPPPASAPADTQDAPASTTPASDDASAPPTEQSPDSQAPVKIAGDGTDATVSTNLSKTAGDAHGATKSTLKPTETETAMRFFVVDKAKNDTAIPGVIIRMQGPDGAKYYTKETDSVGYAEVLVPAGQTYELSYLSLGRRDITAKVEVPEGRKQNIKLTLRYQRFDAQGRVTVIKGPPPPQVFVLAGVNFDTAKATLRPESLPRLESVLEYMTHKTASRIEISGHTDNVGDPEKNKDLSKRRAEACRDHLVSKGIDASRIQTVGYGAERPITSNDSADGRQRNRRIEAKEL